VPLFCIYLPELFSPAVTLESRKDRNDQQHLYDNGLKLPIRHSRALQDNHPSKWGQLPIVMRVHPGAGTIMSWEPDCSPQVMTAITTSLEPSKNKGWDNGQPSPTWPLEHICDWYCLAMHTFCLLPLILYLKLKLISGPQRWLKIGWVPVLPLFMVCPELYNKSFSALHHSSLFGT
jgi:hypothetical protein